MSILKAENLVKIYGQAENSVKALDNVSIEINEGEFVAIVGTSGSGKYISYFIDTSYVEDIINLRLNKS